MLSALVEPERIAGVPEQALDYSTLHDASASFAGIARFEAYLAEPVLALRPDLVLIDPWQAPETSQRLRSFGVRVVALPEVRSWSDARSALEQVGREVGEVERARVLIESLERRVEHLRASAASRPHWRAVCYSNFGGAGSSAGSGTTIDEVQRLAGLENLIATSGVSGHVGLSFEELLNFDPDVILVSQPLRGPAGPAGDRGGASERILNAEATLQGLRAVRERRIVALPAWLFASGSHELVHAAEVLVVELDALAIRLAAGAR